MRKWRVDLIILLILVSPLLVVCGGLLAERRKDSHQTIQDNGPECAQTVEALSTQVAGTFLTALAPSPTASPTSTASPSATPSATWTQTPSATPADVRTETPTMDSAGLCTTCAVIDGVVVKPCPAGYVCQNCYTPAGYRCVRISSPNSDCAKCRGQATTPEPTETLKATATAQATSTEVSARTSTPSPTPTPGGTRTPLPSGQVRELEPVIFIPYDFDNTDWRKVHPEWGACGSMTYWPWDEINPSDGLYNWKPIEEYLRAAQQMTVQLADGRVVPKPVAIEIVLWDAVELSRYIGENYTPGWVASYAGSISSCYDPDGGTGPCKPMCTPNFGNAGWRQQYYRFVRAFGEHFDNKSQYSNLAAVIMATGFDRETVERKDYAGCPYSGNGNSPGFNRFCEEVVAIYNQSFLHTPNFLQDTLHGTPYNCVTMANFPGRSTGEKVNGLAIDVEGSRIFYDAQLVGGVTGFAERYSDVILTGFEPKHDGDKAFLYWMFMEAMSVRPHFIDVQSTVVRHAYEGHSTFPILDWVRAHLGTNVETAPDAWAVLRETKVQKEECWTGSDGIHRCYSPYRGNYESFLYERRDAPQSKSVATPPMGEGLPEPAKSHAYSRERSRRTDQATGNVYLSFDVDDRFKATGWVTVTVTVLNAGADTFTVEVPGYSWTVTKGPQIGTVNQWVDWTVQVPAHALNGGLPGGVDLRIGCNGDGDERVHRVICQRMPSANG